MLDPITIIKSVGMIGVAAIIFAESGLFFGFFFPGDSLLFTAGLLASQNYLSIIPLAFLCAVGAIAGDSIGYWFGKKIGPKLFTKDNSFFFNKEYVKKSQDFFDKYGKKSLILARFIPIVRTFTPILAGVGKMRYASFISYNITGGIGWTVGMTTLGYFFGSLIPNPDKYIIPVALAIILISVLPNLLQYLKSKNKSI